MIRPFTLITALLAGGAGLYLYQVKQSTVVLDRQIARTVRDTEAARARIGVLRAEWALLNQPERLGELSGRFLALKPLAPEQFVALADLDRRLPSPGAAAAEVPAEDEPAPTTSQPISPDATPTAALTTPPASSTPASPTAAAPRRVASRPAAPPSATPAPSVLAPTASRPLTGQVAAYVRPTAASPPTTPSAPPPGTGSLLGAVPAGLAPPVPLDTGAIVNTPRVR